MSDADLICLGRASMDLFSQDIGAAFEDITSFSALVGGTPLNIAVAAHRLGLSAAMLTCLSDDGAGRFVRRFLEREGVITDYIAHRKGIKTNAFFLSIAPPNDFEAIPYEAVSADLWLNVEDVAAAPIPKARAILFTGMGLLGNINRPATLLAAEIASEHGVRVVMDIDYKDYQWPDAVTFGVTTRSALRLTDIAIGTEDEVCAAAGVNDADAAARRVLGLVREAVVVKRDVRGASVYLKNGEIIHAPVYPVTVLNVFGAGDAFAAGLIYGRVSGMDWARSLQLAAACGAIIVTRHGCANDMPTLQDVEMFLQRGD